MLAAHRAKIVRLVVPIAALAALGGMVWRNWESIVRFEWQLSPGPLVLAVCLYAVAVLFTVELWHSVMKELAERHSFALGLRIYLIGLFARRLPGGIWNAISRVYLYRQAGYHWSLTSSAWVLEQIVIGASGFYLGLLLFAVNPWPLPLVGQGIGILGLLLLSLLLYPPILNSAFSLISRLRGGIDTPPPRVTAKAVIRWILMGFLMWLSGGLALYAVIVALAPTPDTALLPVVRSWVVAGAICMLVAVALPSGFGLLELGLVAMLSADLPASLALAGALCMRILTTACDVVAGLAAWRTSHTERPVHNLASARQDVSPHGNGP